MCIKSVRSIGFIVNRVFLVVTGLAALYLVSAFALSVIAVPSKVQDCQTKTTIYMQHSLVHADFAIPTEKLSMQTRNEIQLPEPAGYGPAKFMVFGVGDRDIYVNTPTWAELKARYALKAMFLPTDRAVHVEPAYRVYDGWVPLELCEDQLKALEVYIRNSFKRNQDNGVTELEGLTFTGYDKFYEAVGTYTLFNSCNNWTNGGLKAAGVKTPIWSPFPQGIIYHARRQ